MGINMREGWKEVRKKWDEYYIEGLKSKSKRENKNLLKWKEPKAAKKNRIVFIQMSFFLLLLFLFFFFFQLCCLQVETWRSD